MVSFASLVSLRSQHFDLLSRGLKSWKLVAEAIVDVVATFLKLKRDLVARLVYETEGVESRAADRKQVEEDRTGFIYK